jgi:hypothetical protein
MVLQRRLHGGAGLCKQLWCEAHRHQKNRNSKKVKMMLEKMQVNQQISVYFEGRGALY